MSLSCSCSLPPFVLHPPLSCSHLHSRFATIIAVATVLPIIVGRLRRSSGLLRQQPLGSGRSNVLWKGLRSTPETRSLRKSLQVYWMDTKCHQPILIYIKGRNLCNRSHSLKFVPWYKAIL